MPHTDTSPAAQAVQYEILRAMTGEQRILLAFEMSLFARELASEGIRRDHPEWTETQVAREPARAVELSKTRANVVAALAKAEEEWIAASSAGNCSLEVRPLIWSR